MKKLKLVLFLIAVFLLPVVVFAAEDHKLVLNLAKCDPTAEEMTAAKCRTAYLNGTLETIAPGDSIEPGTAIMATVRYQAGTLKNLIYVQTFLNPDLDVVEPMYGTNGSLLTVGGNKFPTYYDENEDADIKSWTTETRFNYNQFRTMSYDLDYFVPLTGDLDLVYVFIKVKDDAPNGESRLLTFDTSAEATNCNDRNATIYPILTEDYSYNIQSEVSSNTALHSLTAVGNGVNYTSPDFVADSNTVKEYSFIVPNSVDKVNLQATATDANATVLEGTIGEKSLNIGNNEFTVTVSAQSGVQENYKVTIYRLNNDATLSSLTVTNGVDIGTFSSGTLSYTATVPYTTTNTTVSATATDTNATVTGTGAFEFTNYGNTPNVKEVTVKAENCKTEYNGVEGNTCTDMTYTITVNRTAPSSNNNLSELKVNGVLVDGFDKDTLEYTLEDIITDVTSLNVTATAEDTKAEVTIDGEDSIEVGENTITITVTAEDKTTKSYKISVKKLSSDNTLKSLSVNKGVLNPGFESNTKTYTVTMEQDITVINESMITVVANHSEAEIVYDSEKTINGDTTTAFTITVTAENGLSETYTLNVIRTKNSDATLKSLTVSEGTLNPEFKSGITSYTVNVGNEVTSVEVTAEATVSGSNVEITGGENLVVGDNTVKVTVTSEDGTPNTYTINVVRAGNSDATLKEIKVNGILIDGFSSDTLEYTLEDINDNTTSLNVTAEANYSEANVTITGADSIEVGDNTITITVTAEDGTTTKEYTINVKKLSSDNTLKSLSVNKGILSPNFESNTKIYTVTMEEDTAVINESMITATANHNEAEIVYDSEKTINTDTTTAFTITVTAENGQAEMYTLNVIKAKNSDATLKSLTVSEGTLNPEFNANVTSYTVNVGHEVTSVEVTAEATISDSDVEITGGENLVVGDNTVKVTVTSESGDTKEYTINVVRAKSSNASLSELKVNGVLVDGFDKDTLEYTLTKVSYDVTKIDVTATAEDVNATVEGTGEITLKTGPNVIEVVVKAADDTTKTYKINVEREKNDDATLKSLSIDDYELTPDFDKDTLEYTITVTEGADVLEQSKVKAEANDSNAVITLDGDLTLSSTQDNFYNIKVVAENGVATNTYKIKVVKPKSSDATLKSLSINGGTLNPAFAPNEKTYDVVMPNNITKFNKDMITATANHSEATITYSDEIEINSETSSEFVITVTAEDGTTDIYKLNVKSSSEEDLKEITSTKHTIDGDVIKTVKLYETVLELKNNLDNENEHLEVWTSDETEKVADDAKLATGMIVKLIQDGEEIDRKVIAIKGDTSGDGEIDLFDAVMILNHYLEKTALTDAYEVAAYVNDDESVDLFDAVMILNHYLGKTLLH